MSDDISVVAEEKGTKRKWGLLDFLLGFVWMIVLQSIVIVAIAALSWKDISAAYNASNSSEASNQIKAVLEVGLSKPGVLIATNALMYGGWLLATYWASFKRGVKSFAKDFGLTFSWKRDLAIGAIFAVSARILEVAITAILTATGVDLSGASNSGFLDDLSGIHFFVIAVLMAGIIGPFFEELFFRGLGLKAFIRFFEKAGTGDNVIAKFSSNPLFFYLEGMIEDKILTRIYKYRNVLAVTLSSLIFGYMHTQGEFTAGGVFLVTWTALLGVGFAVTTLRSGRLGGAIIAHMLYNLLGVGLMLVFN